MIKKENDSIVYEKVIPAHGAEYVSFPESMRPEIGDYLRSQGISRHLQSPGGDVRKGR